jgi:hypothetical protein
VEVVSPIRASAIDARVFSGVLLDLAEISVVFCDGVANVCVESEEVMGVVIRNLLIESTGTRAPTWDA